MEKCPLCGGRVFAGVCDSCGYELPDYGKISAPYDLDPSNDLFGAAGEEPEFPSIEPISVPEQEFDMPSIGAPRAAPPPRIKSAPQNVPPPNIKVQPPPAPPAQQNPPPYPQYQQYVPPPAPQYQQPGQSGTDIGTAVKEFFKAHWWQILAALIVPWSGYIFGSYYGEKGKKNNSWGDRLLAAGFFIAATVLMFTRYFN